MHGPTRRNLTLHGARWKQIDTLARACTCSEMLNECAELTKQLLEKGYSVRGTVRNKAETAKVSHHRMLH